MCTPKWPGLHFEKSFKGSLSIYLSEGGGGGGGNSIIITRLSRGSAGF